MKILIAGGAGDVGKHLSQYYSRLGDEITVLDKAPVPYDTAAQGIMVYQGSLTDAELVRQAMHKIEAVIDLAWTFSAKPPTVFGEDITGQINLLERAAAEGVTSFVYASTATVYGVPVNATVTEEQPRNWPKARKPLYALGKETAENLCLLYWAGHRLPVSIFRFWWAFGESIGGKNLRDLVGRALDGQTLPIVRGSGGAFVTMEDLAAAFRLAMIRPDAAAGQIYNVGSLFATWEQIARMIIELTGTQSRIEFIPAEKWQGPAFLNEVWALNWEKAARELGYSSCRKNEDTLAGLTGAIGRCVREVRAARAKCR